MILDYGTLLSPIPIKLSIGTIRKPTLHEISVLTFPLFDTYRTYIEVTPEVYYTKLNIQRGEHCWKNLSDDVKSKLTIYDLILNEEDVKNIFTDILNFYFVEPVCYSDGVFLVLNSEKDMDLNNLDKLTLEDVKAVINRETFFEVLDIIKQLCYIKIEDGKKKEELKFKNDRAKELWERMQQAEKEKQTRIARKEAIHFTIPNMISVVSSAGIGLDIINIWGITLFQLYIMFYRLQNTQAYEIKKTQCSVWGDEKGTFNLSMYYKNIYENE